MHFLAEVCRFNRLLFCILMTSQSKETLFFQDYLLFIPTYGSDVSTILGPRPIDSSDSYKKHCIDNYELRTPVTKQCYNWLFRLVIPFINGPSPCDCQVRGSHSASCNLIGGQCRCKNHIIGRTCYRCLQGYTMYPKCVIENRIARYSR